jgi:hypothetical protein
MLDPSTLTPSRLDRASVAVDSLLSADTEVVLPRAFAIAAIELRLSARDAAYLFGWPIGHERYGRTYDEPGSLDNDLATPVANWISSRTDAIRWFDARDVSEQAIDLFAGSPLEFQVMQEEWAFLQSRSLVASRLKRRFTRFVAGGATVVEVGRRAVERIERRTLHRSLEAEDHLTAINHLRAGAKWFAAGGGSAVALAEPLIGIPLQIVGPWFLLLDP